MGNVGRSCAAGCALDGKGQTGRVKSAAMFAAPQMDQFNAAFGQVIATANYPRQIQAVFRFTF